MRSGSTREAHDADFNVDELSFDDLEAQVSNAARELAEADRAKQEAAGDSARSKQTTAGEREEAGAGGAGAAAASVDRRRRANSAGRLPPFAAANDDALRTPPHLLRTFESRSGRAAFRNAVIISALWVVAGLVPRQSALRAADLADPVGRRSGRDAGWRSALPSASFCRSCFSSASPPWSRAHRNCAPRHVRWPKWRCAWQSRKALRRTASSLSARPSAAKCPR